ncbi:uncharacterized protein [Lolium perenne]|uniref:uncharacterized protein isoform X7 n=1 Tax=Lolium perenne TaxID=4522 RepID=UPI003A99E705
MAMPEVNTTRCRDKAIDLNQPPCSEQGCGFTYVLLARDNKNICRTKVYDVPNRITIPSVWPIMKFMRMDQYQQNDFLKFSLHPDPEDDYQAKEWGIFMRFLRENKKAGVVEFRSITFHILAPESHSYYAEVFYETVLKDPGVCRKMEGKSGRSNTSEETCDNIRHTKEMQSLHKLHRFVPESSTCDSIEDGPRVLDPAVKNKTSTLASNFVKTSPSYLRTLSQTHAGWIFGAIAELIDNSRDASASRLDISIQSMFSKKAGGKVPVLCVFDNGHGMTYHQMMKMVLFGHDRPNEHRQDQIGRFGIGFKVPLDYSLKAYLEVIFLNPQMKVTVQGSPSYKRVGGQKHNAVTGRGIIGVADITDLIDDEDGNTWVLNSKQGFQDCEMYAKLEEWLGRKTDEYWNTNFDNLELRKGGELIKAVDDVVQCRSCRKCRKLNQGFNTASLPLDWFCHMEPFNGNCDIPEEELEVAVITVAEKISGHNKVENFRQDEDVKNVRLISPPTHSKGMSSSDSTICEDCFFLHELTICYQQTNCRAGVGTGIRNNVECECTGVGGTELQEEWSGYPVSELHARPSG